MMDSPALRRTKTSSLALAANDLRVDLISARVEQLDGLILQLPYIAVVPQIGIVRINSLAWDQLRGFQPYGCCLCYHLRLCRAGRQAKAEQPNHEQVCCCA
jgi:hypothetical protein